MTIVILPATPAAKLVPNVVLCTPLDPTSEAERGILAIRHPRVSTSFAQTMCPGEVTLVLLRSRNNTGDSSYEL